MPTSPGREAEGRPRFVPQRPLPPYSYVPGHAPHPVSHPDGHMFGAAEPENVAPLIPDRWRESEQYLYGIDLFNHGYYWESHEAWEALWHAEGRRGRTADFLKALIKLAAAAVKAREGSPVGAERHGRRCCELLRIVADSDDKEMRFAGLSLPDLAEAVGRVANAATKNPAPNALYDVVLPAPR